jgi:hypothetical protein
LSLNKKIWRYEYIMKKRNYTIKSDLNERVLQKGGNNEEDVNKDGKIRGALRCDNMKKRCSKVG